MLKQNDIIIEEPNSSGTPEWYLVYKTTNPAISESGSGAAENNLKCYIYPKTPVAWQKTPGATGIEFSKTPNDFVDLTIYGITDGGVKFNNVLIKGKYLDEADFYGSTMGLDTPALSNQMFAERLISGEVNVGDTFTAENNNYTCYAVVWYKNQLILGEDYLSLPMGLFKSSNKSDNNIYYGFKASYSYKLNNTTYNDTKWVIARKMLGISVGEVGSMQWLTTKITGEIVLADNAFTPVNYIEQNWADSELTDDDISFGKKLLDSNWARNAFIFNEGTLHFTDKVSAIYSLPYENKTPTTLELNSGEVYFRNGLAGTTSYISHIDFLDRADPTLVKILALPYCPTAIQLASGSLNSENYTITFDTNIVASEQDPTHPEYNRLYYSNLGNTFGKDLLPVGFDFSANDSILDYYYNNEIGKKDISNESKLYNSNFYKDTFVYDNVNKVIRREDITTTDKTVNITPYYQPTNTLTSTMLFNFKVNNGSYNNITDWDQVLISTRNNELPIYNNDYLNYMRYGYGAEKDALESTAEAQRQAYTTNATLGIVGGTFGGAVSGAALGAKFAGVGAIPGAIIGAVVGLVSSIAKTSSAINTTETNIANAQKSLAAKVEEKRNSAATVQAGFSSVDLMTNYTGNRLHLMTYEMPDILKDAVYDRLYYCGYSCPTQGKPSLDSRLLFNFVQAEPTFIDEATSVYNYYLTDIKDRINTGITIYHDASEYLSTLDTSELMYDFKQQFENWETFEKILPDNYTVSNLAFAGPYVRTITDTTDTHTARFVPSANNNFRYKLTYRQPGSNVELTYPYSSNFDFSRGYTLSTNINYTDFENRGITVENGTIISVRLIDITGEWADSEPVYLVVNNTIKTEQGSFVPYTKYDGYYIWKSLTLTDYYCASNSLTPLRGSEIYEAYQGQDDTWEIDFGANHTITSAEGFSK